MHVLTEQEILWLYLNPQYPVKNYTLADWQIDAGNPENALIAHAPKYLGITENLTNTRTVIITKGERTGAVDANAGDWVLMGAAKDGRKCGVCYKWSGAAWEETENPQHTQAVLTDALELCRKMGKDEQIPAVQFAKKLVALEAFVENLSAQVVYFQKSVASLVSKTPKVGDQMIYMGHNYRQYDKNEPFSFGIDELAYKGYSEGNQIETWRHLMKTSQIKSLAGASILSLFLTGCIRANGGVELPPGSVISANKVENFRCAWRSAPAVTADGQKAMSEGGNDFVYSDDGLKTFKKIIPKKIEMHKVTAYQNKFYAVKKRTADYYSSTDGENWSKEGTIAPYQSGDKWVIIFDETAKSLGFVNFKTGERKYIYNPPEHIISAPSDKPNRGYIVKSNKITIAHDANKYDGLSISLDKGNTWEHIDGLFPEYKNSNEKNKVILTYYNGVFYLWCSAVGRYSGLSNGYHTSKDGKNWETHRPEIKNMRYITTTDNSLLLIYNDNENKDTLIENIETSANKAVKSGVIQKIQNLNVIYGRYYPQINSVVLTGSTQKDGYSHGALYIMQTEGILTGSGIVDFQCNKQFLAARFGNGLQILATSFLGSPLEYPFVDEPFSITDSLSGRTTLQIGRWF